MSQPKGCHNSETYGLISLGSNVLTQRYQPLGRLHKALSDLQDAGLVIRNTSQMYHTPFFPPNHGADFVNAVAIVSGPYNAEEVLARLHQVENDHNRVRETRWADRTLDLDLIFWGEEIRPNIEVYRRWRDLSLEKQMSETPEELILPHPRVQDRAFVLIPMLDVLPHWKHPISGESVNEMLAALPESDKSAIKPLEE